MNSLPRVEIRNHGGSRTEILIDGQPLRGVISYALEQRGGNQPVLTLCMRGVDMSVDSAMLPALPDFYAGWYEESKEAREAKPIDADPYVC